MSSFSSKNSLVSSSQSSNNSKASKSGTDVVSHFYFALFLYFGAKLVNVNGLERAGATTPESFRKMSFHSPHEIFEISNRIFWLNGKRPWSSNRKLFQGNSAERSRDSNKIITLPLVLLFCVFDFYIIFCKYPCFSPILSAAEFDGRCLKGLRHEDFAGLAQFCAKINT